MRMKGDAEVVGLLNEALSEELTAINQYFLHAEILENWGYKKLAGFIKKDSIDEMKHAETILERILFLDGAPNMSNYRKLEIGKTVTEMLANDLKLELGAREMYNRLIDLAIKKDDQGTADLMKKLLKDEEGHVDGLEAQMTMIQDMGLQVYLSIQV
jgi:bacterioferritin